MSSNMARILVVEDEFLNRMVLSTSLRKCGYEVEMAEDGKQAMEMLAAGPFDVVLLDLLMPEMDGYQVLERMKADSVLRNIPVIVISSLDEMESVLRCIEMGATDYMPKPFDSRLLHARLHASLADKRLHDMELEYIEQVNHVTRAAAAVEAGTFAVETLDRVAQREDSLGQLARVFQTMARQVYEREVRLKQQVEQLRIEIDEVKRAREVEEITQTDYFRALAEKAQRLRARNSKGDST
ncbi:MAG: response regulator [Anaerolineae bacterium]